MLICNQIYLIILTIWTCPIFKNKGSYIHSYFSIYCNAFVTESCSRFNCRLLHKQKTLYTNSVKNKFKFVVGEGEV